MLRRSLLEGFAPSVVFLVGIILGMPAFVCSQSMSRSAQQKPPNSLDLTKLSRAVASVTMYSSDGKMEIQGSGFFIDSTGRMVTNYHVIKDASSAFVKTSDGGLYLVLGLLAVDEKHDLAILVANGSNFPFISLGNSDKVSVGQRVYAIGSPLGLENTVSDGIVSAFRVIDEVRFIQTTAPISSGSSGGALLNMSGQVIGITTSQLEVGQNLNFAIPSNLIRPLLNSTEIIPFALSATEVHATSEVSNPPRVPVDEFAGLPSEWNSALSDNQYSLRILGKHLYLRSEFIKGVPGQMDDLSLNCDAQRLGHDWVGTCQWRVTLLWQFNHDATTCSLLRNFEVASVSKERIEGTLQNLNPPSSLGACPTLDIKQQQFTLIPRY
jgi:trypsin-like peptidase